MSWNVGVLEDKVKISKSNVKKANEEIDKITEYGGGELFSEETGELLLDYDAREWIDPFQRISEEDMKTVLKYKPKGKLLFSSAEGDNAGDSWGYEFDGKGGVKYLTAELVWKVTGEDKA